MTQFTVALHDIARAKLCGEAAKLSHVFSGVDIVVLFGTDPGLLPLFGGMTVLAPSDGVHTIAIASQQTDVTFGKSNAVFKNAELRLIRKFQSEGADTVRTWLNQANGSSVALFTFGNAKVGIVAWNAARVLLPRCPGGYAAFSAAYVACLLSAASELSPTAKWRIAGNIPFASVSEGAAAHRTAAELGVTLFNHGVSASTWSRPQMVQTAAGPRRPCLCFGVSRDSVDMAGRLVSEMHPPSMRWPWHQTPVYLVVNWSIQRQLWLWFTFVCTAILVSSFAVGCLRN